MGVLCTRVIRLTDLRILCCELYRNAFGGEAVGGTAGLGVCHRRQRHRGRRGYVPGNIWSAGDEVTYIPGKV